MYRILDIPNREIRLIRFAETNVDTPTTWVFEMKHVSLDADPPPEYTALSYVWGQPDPGKFLVLVNGTTLSITSNLNDAMTAISKLDKPQYSTWWWIDAICINQDDLEERASQVKLMRELYSRASRTLAYLDDGAGGSSRGMLWLETLELERVRQENPSKWIIEAVEKPVEGRRNSEEVATCLFRMNSDNDLSFLPLPLSTRKTCQYRNHRL